MPSIEQLRSQLKQADSKVVAHERLRPHKNSPGYKTWKTKSERLTREAGSLRGQLSTEEMKQQSRTS